MKANKYITLLASAALMTACDLDKFPEAGVITEDQKNEVIADDPGKIAGDLNALKNNLIQFGTVSTDVSTYHYDYGFPSICLMYDMAGQDMVSEDVGYNWFASQLTFTDRIPTSKQNELVWKLHYQHIKTANSILTKMYADYTEEERVGNVAEYIGQALAGRAFDYLQLIQTYQFTYLGHENAMGLPIMDENTTVDQATNNPRVSVQEVYDLIMKDLNYAIELFETAGSNDGADKASIDVAVAYGLRARANMLLGKYAEAASDADKSLTLSGATPYTRTEVSVPSFNNDTHSWIWGAIITSNNDVVTTGIINWPSHLCSLTGNGYTTGVGESDVHKRINKNLWDKIPASDVRKTWWVDENLQSEALNNAYGAATGAQVGQMAVFAPYTNVKFGPQADVLFNTENSQDWPLMRAEEMILIKAEALARSQSVAAGKTVLEDFVKNYRDSQYTCTASSLEDFIDEVWFQRRVELWGEGFSLFDILRLKKPIVRLNSNFSANVTYNDIAPESPIMIYCIPECETSSNKGITLDQINEVATPPVPAM